MLLFFTMSRTVSVPMGCASLGRRRVLPLYAAVCALQSNLSSGPTAPSLSAADTGTILNVEPGSYWSEIARLRRTSWLNLLKSLGSKSG